MKIKIKSKTIELMPPQSLATCMDFVGTYKEDMPQAHFARLMAGTIGVCSETGSGLPKYHLSHADPISYGHGCLDALFGKGASMNLVYTTGQKMLNEMAKRIPTEEEVEEAENFFGETEAESPD